MKSLWERHLWFMYDIDRLFYSRRFRKWRRTMYAFFGVGGAIILTTVFLLCRDPIPAEAVYALLDILLGLAIIFVIIGAIGMYKLYKWHVDSKYPRSRSTSKSGETGSKLTEGETGTEGRSKTAEGEGDDMADEVDAGDDKSQKRGIN